jgi:CBS domain-containing protein
MRTAAGSRTLHRIGLAGRGIGLADRAPMARMSVAPEAGNPVVWVALAAVALPIVVVLARRAAAWMRGRTVEDVMIENVITIDGTATLAEAAQRMRDGNIGVLPVLENGKVRGVITDRDLVVRGLARGADPRTTRVQDCATDQPVCAHPEWSVDEAMEAMAASRIGRLPVVDGQDRVIGMVTLSSLALRSRRQDEALETAQAVSRRSARPA